MVVYFLLDIDYFVVFVHYYLDFDIHLVFDNFQDFDNFVEFVMKSISKRISFLSVLCLCGVVAMGQNNTPPDWMDAQTRERLYPTELYYTGFAYGERRAGESVDETVQR